MGSGSSAFTWVLKLARVGPIGMVPFVEGGFGTFRHGQTLLLAESGKTFRRWVPFDPDLIVARTE